MHRYRVVEHWPDSDLVGLKCQMGRYHLVRALSTLPAPATILHGDRPHLGFGMLSCASSGRIFRVIFESINHAQALSAPSWLRDTALTSSTAHPPVAARVGK